ncbi:MAG: hypothetical protein KGK03_04175 [Candidatus Omnitrophica bacterium]|nr:hypothetical protein [Candidatus Omnitrophota bacterium]MDE2222250.1 hypothetical protein [Candidatus Omnitrophota bacterium]
MEKIRILVLLSLAGMAGVMLAQTRSSSAPVNGEIERANPSSADESPVLNQGTLPAPGNMKNAAGNEVNEETNEINEEANEQLNEETRNSTF